MYECHLKTVFLIGVTILLSFVSVNFAVAAKIQSGVTINQVPTSIATCGLELLSGVPINYGQLTAQAGLSYVRSADQKVTYSNTGNASAQVMVKGGDWTGGSAANPQTFSGPEWTHVASDPNVDWQSKMNLKSSEIPLGQLGPGQTGQSYWQVQIPTNTGINGSIHQEVTIDLNCQEGATTNSSSLSNNAANSLGDKALLLATTPQSKIIPSQQGTNYFVTVIINWPKIGLLDTVNPQQGQVFLLDVATKATTLVGVVNQGGEVPLSYTLKASPDDSIYAFLRTKDQQRYSERIVLGSNTNPILHINVR
jgi:hypothetical protein